MLTPLMEFLHSSRHLIDNRLRFRLRIFLGISLVLAAIMVFDIFRGVILWWLAFVAVLVGLLIGYLFGRMVKVVWHPTEEKIVTRMDIVGAIAIAAYVLLALARNVLLKEFFSGATLTAFTFAVVSGILFGRFLGMRFGIRKQLDEGRRTP